MKNPQRGWKGEFVIHDHKAKRHHWDLRLEVPADKEDFEIIDKESYQKLGIKVEERETVMRSFAIPKARFPKVKERILAVEVEPHPKEYNNFEGKIPEGEYGAGDVKIFDKGEVEWISSSDKKLEFILNGKIIKSKFVMVKMNDKNWLLMLG